MLGNGHVRFGRRAAETGRSKGRHRAAARPHTKLRGPGRGIGFQLYVVLDIFSCYVVAWTVQAVEDSGIAKTMLEEAMGVHGIPEAVHAGAPR
jgi:transposase InsO family protein